ncbi:hypothetical protein ACGFJC_24040 [Nonomuraea fuscirosea]
MDRSRASAGRRGASQSAMSATPERSRHLLSPIFFPVEQPPSDAESS